MFIHLELGTYTERPKNLLILCKIQFPKIYQYIKNNSSKKNIKTNKLKYFFHFILSSLLYIINCNYYMQHLLHANVFNFIVYHDMIFKTKNNKISGC